jgi:hypothetical protein
MSFKGSREKKLKVMKKKFCASNCLTEPGCTLIGLKVVFFNCCTEINKFDYIYLLKYQVC